MFMSFYPATMFIGMFLKEIHLTKAHTYLNKSSIPNGVLTQERKKEARKEEGRKEIKINYIVNCSYISK